jgi:hypothetical protein
MVCIVCGLVKSVAQAIELQARLGNVCLIVPNLHVTGGQNIGRVGLQHLHTGTVNLHIRGLEGKRVIVVVGCKQICGLVAAPAAGPKFSAPGS